MKQSPICRAADQVHSVCWGFFVSRNCVWRLIYYKGCLLFGGLKKWMVPGLHIPFTHSVIASPDTPLCTARKEGIFFLCFSFLPSLRRSRREGRSAQRSRGESTLPDMKIPDDMLICISSTHHPVRYINSIFALKISN